MESWVPVIAIVVISLLIFLFIGMPIAFALGLLVLIYSTLLWGTESFVIVSGTAFAMTSANAFLSIPLFVLMAELLTFSGAGRDLFDVVDKWIGRMPGGLGISTEVASAIMASLVGISVANAAIVGAVAIPQMQQHGYSKRLAAGAVAAGGTLGILIPPSLSFIMFGMVSDLSIGHLFLAGVVPGWILTCLFSLYIFSYALINPKEAPKGESFTFAEKIKALPNVIPSVGLAILMLFMLYTGVATANEIASIGVFGSFVILLIYRKLTRTNMKEALFSTIKVTCMVMWIIISSSMFSQILAFSGLSEKMVTAVLGLSSDRYMIMFLINFILLILGCILDPGAIIMITVPIFIPIITALGFDPIVFGVIFIINMEMGYLTPPFGMNLFILKTIAPDIPMSDIIRGCVPFLFCQAALIILLTVFPGLALLLIPRAAG